MMKFSNVRLLVKDYEKCFEFYTKQLGLEVAWGNSQSGYASFKVADGIEGLAIFPSDEMAKTIGNADKALPSGGREKSLVSFGVEDVDAAYRELSARGLQFINTPVDRPCWGMRVVHLHDPEGNLVELFSELPPEKWCEEMKEAMNK